MSTLLAVLLLALATAAWFGLALLPALRELVRGTDVQPLQLRRGGGDVRHFALGFDRFAKEEVAALTARERVPAGGGAVVLRRGEPAWFVPGGAGPATLPAAGMPADALASHVVLSTGDLAVADGSSVLKELYVQNLAGGADCSYRAVLALGDATLGPRSGVLRWIDAGGTLVAGADSVLWGRASASVEMRLLEGTHFQRVAAPAITFGSAGLGIADRPPSIGADAPPGLSVADVLAPGSGDAAEEIVRPRRSVVLGTRAPLEPPPGVSESFGRWFILSDFEVPSGEHVEADLIVTGTLRVGVGARVRGAVKCAVLEGAPGVIYDGAIVATDRLVLGAGSEVAGPIVVEGAAHLGALSQVGTRADPTTVSAVLVRAGGGAVVYGEVWARERGEVVVVDTAGRA